MNIDETFRAVLDKLIGWVQGAVKLLPDLGLALLVVILFWLGARGVRSLMLRTLGRISRNRQITHLLATLGYIAVLLAGVFFALSILSLDKTVTSLLAGVGIIGLALGFAFQDLAANFISGIYLSLRHPFELDDIVETNGFMGVVREVSLRSTLLRTFEGQTVLIPNKEIFTNPLVNYTSTGKRRVDLSVGVSYGDDLEKVKRVALGAVEAVEGRDRSREVELFYKAFGDSSIDFDIRFWIAFRKQTDFLRARSEALMRIKAAFDAEGITIPFPIRTLDFGAVGGETLAEALPPAWRGNGPSERP